MSRSLVDATRDAWAARRRSELVTAADDDVISLAEAKAHLRRVDNTDEDTLITALLTAAVHFVETDTARALLTQTWRTWFDEVPCGGVLLLDRGKAQSVTAIKTYDTTDVESTVATTVYQVDAVSEPARVSLRSGQTWPSGLRTMNALSVTYSAGYGTDAETVPGPLKQAALLILGAMFEHREQVIVAQFAGQFLALPFGYDQLVAPYRLGFA